LAAELAQANAQVQQLTGQLTERAKEIEVLRSEAARQMSELQASMAHERELAQAIRDDLLRAQFKLEGHAELQANVTFLSERCQQAERAAAVSSQEAAVAQAKLAFQLERAEEARVREEQTRNKG
jgi:hypothetical protein